MKEVVWVFGTSASGKETFIKRVASGKPFDLIKNLGWEGKAVTASNESLNLIDGELGELRDKVIEKIPVLLQKTDVILIKWQYVDSAAKRPQRLKDSLPDARHRIIELEVDMDELVMRLPRKHWWYDLGKEKESLTKELDMVANSLGQLPDFDKVSIDSNESGNYRIT